MAEYFTKDGDEYKKVSDSLFTQSDMDGVIEKRLERERGKFADYDSLKEKAGKVDDLTKDFENKLKDKDTKIGELEGSVKSANLATEKVKIVSKYKLSDDLAEFVTGDTADDMDKKAEKLSKGITGGTVVIDKKPKPGESTSDNKAIAKGLFGGNSD